MSARCNWTRVPKEVRRVNLFARVTTGRGTAKGEVQRRTETRTVLGVGPDRFAVALAPVPPLWVPFVLAFDPYVSRTDPASTSRASANMGKAVVNWPRTHSMLLAISRDWDIHADREDRIRAITNRLIEPGPGSLQEKLGELRSLAVTRLTEMRRLLAKPKNVHEARALLAERVAKFTLFPSSYSAEWSYTAKGSLGFLSETTLRVDGAGGLSGTMI